MVILVVLRPIAEYTAPGYLLAFAVSTISVLWQFEQPLKNLLAGHNIETVPFSFYETRDNQI